MRPSSAALFLFTAVLFHSAGSAQVMLLPTPAPAVTAAGATWQINGEPIFYEGAFYYPAGPTIFFDGNVMARTGVYQNVPLYQDRTLVPYSVIFVPIGGTVMRPYERRREGELAGTTGSRTPSFPVQPSTGPLAGLGVVGVQSPPVGDLEPLRLPEATTGSFPANVGSATVDAPAPTVTAPTANPAPANTATGRAGRTGPMRADIWFTFEGERWYASGPAVAFTPERFTPAGNHEGMVVYRSPADPAVVFLTIVPGGPLVPFQRR
jgi:hypothetical protein